MQAALINESAARNGFDSVVVTHGAARAHGRDRVLLHVPDWNPSLASVNQIGEPASGPPQPGNESSNASTTMTTVPTLRLDDEEAAILGSLRVALDMTVLVVAHRISTILLADEVVFLDEGRVVATGTHAQLLRRDDYRALVTAYEQDDR